ncbi:MAG: glyceraldehyde-3-phosphate dehydrogenase [Burkholderiaceae bacterium]|nr:glyceraldehyde-3-phosphate dehydrogenase [Microbacteriaceae bacterium]
MSPPLPPSSQLQEARQDWQSRESLAESMIPLIGRLYRDHGVVTSVFGRSLINQSVIGVIKGHRYARHVAATELLLEDSVLLLHALLRLELGPVSVDLARLQIAFERQSADQPGVSLDQFLAAQLQDSIGRSSDDVPDSRDIVLYGFGRIGRLLARILIERSSGLVSPRLRAVVVRKGSVDDLDKRASLLRRDSVHGPFSGTITVDRELNRIIANGTVIQVIYSSDPATVDYTAHGIANAIVIDTTGRWRDEEGLSQHLRATGVSRVLLTAPGKGALKNIVHGINHDTITDDDLIITAASCTTNAVTPVLKAINDRFVVEHCHVETVHSFTNDQNLIDNFHPGARRGRSAALNMVLTETGAAKAVAKALPELAGRLTGNSIRVPTPDVSMAILNLTLATETERDELNEYLRSVSLDSALRRQIDYIESSEVVSSDFIGSRRAGVVDGLATIVTGRHAVVYVWYDNENGYSYQVIRVLEELTGAPASAHPETESIRVVPSVALPSAIA